MPAYLALRADGARRFDCSGVVSIGRDARSDVRLDDPRASRHHALVQEIGCERYYVIDLGSRNGSSVNGRRVTVPTPLSNADVLSIGSTELVFHQRLPAGLADTDTGRTTTMIRADVRAIIILVADIRGYTPLAERVPVHDLARLMAAWFDGVQKAVAEHDGMVDKFVGDCVMAIWEPEDDDRCGAVAAALGAALAIQELTAGLGGEQPLRIGVGLNMGVAAMGAGIERSVVGDSVNLAFRLETASKRLGADAVLSKTAYQVLPAGLVRGNTHRVRVKGKTSRQTIVSFSFGEVERVLAVLET